MEISGSSETLLHLISTVVTWRKVTFFLFSRFYQVSLICITLGVIAVRSDRFFNYFV